MPHTFFTLPKIVKFQMPQLSSSYVLFDLLFKADIGRGIKVLKCFQPIADRLFALHFKIHYEGCSEFTNLVSFMPSHCTV